MSTLFNGYQSVVFAASEVTNDSAAWHNLLWLVAVALVLYGLYLIFVKKAVGQGVFLIIVGLLIGPGGVSILS